MQERNSNTHPTVYASRLCTTAERNYSITERETLAVIYYLEHFRDMILGYKIRVWTDHTVIQNLFKHKNFKRTFSTLVYNTTELCNRIPIHSRKEKYSGRCPVTKQSPTEK